MKKVALVTGNYQGLGKAISDKLIAEGYEEPMIVRSKDYDLTKVENCQRLVKDVITKYGQLDLLVNNVGNYINKNISELSFEEWHELFDSNLNASFYLSQLALPELRKSNGCIVNIGLVDIESLETTANVGAYQAAKTALLVYSKALNQAEDKVSVQVYSPGYLENSVDLPSDGRELTSLSEAANQVWGLVNQVNKQKKPA